MAAPSVLTCANAKRVIFRDSLDLDSRHIQLPLHRFSASYIFFRFDNWKNSNYLGLQFDVKQIHVGRLNLRELIFLGSKTWYYSPSFSRIHLVIINPILPAISHP